MSRRVGWRFAVEPIGQRFAWSLFTSTADDEINLVDAGTLPVALVDSTFQWARQKPKNKFQYFKRGLTVRAARIGIDL